MRNLILFLILFPFLSIGQVSDKISFQAVVYDNQNKLVVNRNVGVRMSIISGSVDGTVVYQETHMVTTSGTGLFTLQLGGGTPTIGTYGGINWGASSHFLKREFDINGGTNYQIMGIGEILSVPYAIYASVSDTTLKVPDNSPTNEIQSFSVSPTGDTLFLSSSNFVIVPGISAVNPSIKDIDNNQYSTVNINGQIWMAENLKTTKYRGGTTIAYIEDNEQWINCNNTETGGWCYYGHNLLNNVPYGKLYNWYAIQGDSICPIGWHVPSLTEWNLLIDFLGGQNIAGGKMKSLNFWEYPNSGATNEVGFNAVPGGARNYNGDFPENTGLLFFPFIKKNGTYWSSSITFNFYYPFFISLNYNDTKAESGGGLKTNGLSIRCIKN